MSLLNTIKTGLHAHLYACILLASQIAIGDPVAHGQTWGGLYDMDRMLSEKHPFTGRQTPGAPPPQSVLGRKTKPLSSRQPKIIPPTTVGADKGRNLNASNYFSEIRIGALLHDSGPFSSSDEGGIDTNLELLFSPPKFLSILWEPRPHLGISYNSAGDTSQAYLGLTWDWSFWGNWFAEFSLGGMVHDGHLVGVDGESKSLGCRGLFRESLNAGYRFMNRHALMLHLDHSSNASLCEKNTKDGTEHGRHNVILNEGLENIGIRYGYIF